MRLGAARERERLDRFWGGSVDGLAFDLVERSRGPAAENDQRQQDAGSDGDRGDAAEELNRGQGSELPARDTGKEIAERGGHEPDAHHLADQTLRCEFGYRAKPHGTQTELAARVEEVSGDQPGRNDLHGFVLGIDGGPDHHQEADA